MSEQLPLFAPQRHAHLALAAATDPGPRQPRNPGRGGSAIYTDRPAHAREIGQQATTLISSHRRRNETLGVDPELILVLETNGPLDPIEVERAGLNILELRSNRALVAFAADPELTQFVARNVKYMEGTRGLTDNGNIRQAHYEQLFDRIDRVRMIEPDDLVGANLTALRSSGINSSTIVRLEIRCWCSEVEAEARRRNQEVRVAVGAAGGVVLSTSVRPQAGWSALCCDLPIGAVDEVIQTGRISWIDVMPNPSFGLPQMLHATPESLPTVLEPDRDAPILAVIDSGIRAGHPLLAPAVVGVERVGDGLGDGGDESGHGTLVASLGLYGSLEGLLLPSESVRPAGRLLSVRVLDGNNQFPSDSLWADALLEAMNLAADSGARILNLSIGDGRRPYGAPRPTAVGAIVDQFVRAHPDVVVITCTGNVSTAEHDVDRLVSGDYIQDLIESPRAGLLDPGTAALAITVGGLGNQYHQGVASAPSAEKVVTGGPDLPSAHTRVGPGPMNAVKPELSAASGNVVVDSLLRRAAHDRIGMVVGAGGKQADRLLAADRGTSFAAPLVSHAALRILQRYPALNGNSVRALLLVGASKLDDYLEGGAVARQSERRLTGFGRVSAERSEASTDHRVVLLGEDIIRMDQVHVFRVPIPTSFREAGGRIGLVVSLAFDPPVRVTRLDYLASKMGFQVFHGPSVADVRAAYVKAETTEEMQEEVSQTPTELRPFQLDLQPADRTRSRGANQLGRLTRHTKVPEGRPDEYVIAVRNLNRWDVPQADQAYSIAVLLERDTGHPKIYSELRAVLEPLVRLEAEAEAEN